MFFSETLGLQTQPFKIKLKEYCCNFLSPSIQYIFRPLSPALPVPLSNHMSCYLKTNVPNVPDTTTKTTSDKHMDALMFFPPFSFGLRYSFLWPGSTNNPPATSVLCFFFVFFFFCLFFKTPPWIYPSCFPFTSPPLPSSPFLSSPELLIVVSSYSSSLSPPPPTPTSKPFPLLLLPLSPAHRSPLSALFRTSLACGAIRWAAANEAERVYITPLCLRLPSLGRCTLVYEICLNAISRLH